MERFGAFEDEDVHRLTIRDGTLTANVVTWGALIQDLRLAGHAPPLVLGFETFEPYPEHSPYFGATPGRVANRIRNATAPLGKGTVRLDANVRGVHHLHGGSRGIGRRVWRIEDRGTDFVALAVDSPDGDMGYPGNYTARCLYRIEEAGLTVELSAATDAPTFSNLCHHSYFNLKDGGRSPITDHVLEVAADTYLETDDDFVATGAPVPVGGTRFDYRRARPIHEGQGEPPIWDNNYCLSNARTKMRRVATVRSPDGAIEMAVSTTEPGLQFYAGHKIDVPSTGLDGIAYGPRSGLCLEAQAWPDAPNNPGYPSILLHPGNAPAQISRYAFHRA